MANPPKPWKAEYAKSGRSSCKSCKNSIDKDQLRLGKMVAATQFDGFMPTWNHAGCIFKKGNQIKSVDDVEGIDLLRWEDQQKIRKYVEGGSVSATAVSNDECAMEVSQTSRAACRRCNQKIMKGMVRVSTKPEGRGARGLAWHHVNCFIDMSPSTILEKISGWDSLSPEDKATITALAENFNSNTAQEQHASKGTKRKKVGNEDHKSKVPKSDKHDSAGGPLSKGSAAKSGNANSSSAELEKKLEEQSKALWDIKDELKKHVTTAELREMLEANGQDSAGSEYDLRDRCADGMLFGALGKCPICSGSLNYSGGQYRCHGYVSAWSKCSCSMTDPVRLKEKWKIPDETSNQYLLKWFKSQKAKKPTRVLPPSSCKSSSSTLMQSQPSNGDNLENLKVAIVGESQKAIEDWKHRFEEAGGKIHAKIKKDTNCLVLIGEMDDDDSEIRKARRMKIPIMREDYLHECIRKQKKIPFDLYKVEAASETSRSDMVTVKVKGRSAVHEASGLQDTGHILEGGNSIYNTTLNMSDLSTGVNSYYILQIIQEDKGSACYVFRKWGRVGNDKIGGTKLEEMPKSDAVKEFKRLFLEKTGNPWEAWEQKKNFEKQPGKFFPLDIDYGVKQASKKEDSANTKSLLAPQLIELMKMLFDVETYRAAMMEFEINMSEMPLGKLSKTNIQKGFEALTVIQNLLNNNAKHDPVVKESLIVDASNRFFTLIPSIHPHVIRDEDDFKAKVKMLEALQDIEIASRLVGFDSGNDESLDETYKKLRCDITPLPHDSEDFKLVEKYLYNTHAPTHKDWSLQLEEVFALEREGEYDKYASYRDKLHNKMLLWHGSRLTNFVGILSQGLRIAPPEAPATGYMFGKGIYFADLVSKSAQYCYVDKKNPVGLMLLSEVALGEIYELKKATYIEKPPKGKHSTKGLGKTAPLESEFVKWRDQVVVPCGKPVPSSIRASELLYNEYIVYNTAQVKLQFLLKVRFHHKR
ncbi:LOW QUALITY PROTEIN: poly [ADP-ribose] polymerase 1 [Phoenix dactylifera]|uniref:Poly [ADP-ribose] polymerase n=1 Tax=Phoenix dactylifera TaxID=42345 RepID=A0A8B7C937_PHODC|nr:LOW QUALITY PROTEIN: poly [ADP-ribose] polymerase 1 [Phoenix dactylifera]